MSEKVVTRFAPSPTGYLHVGGARTALFNWLWARRTGGTFVLRIEDTDQKRNTPTAAKQVMDDLRWLGIDWDEGPGVGGPNGPYLQSQRMDIYDKYVRQLLDEKKAYYCFDTAEDLDALREEAEAQTGGFAYQRPDEFPTAHDAEKARAEGRPVTVRFAVPQDEPLVVQDVVRGEITFAPGEISDFIIQKSDCFPTYNFACVVDDYLMKITYVIRGQEHLNNTPGQQALWRALFPDAELPKYAHMSVTVSDTGGKLSKRERPRALRDAIKHKPNVDLDKLAQVAGLTRDELDSFIEGTTTPDMPNINAMAEFLGVPLPEINIVDFFKSGYLPETMVNFLALLGWNPGDDREVMRVEELIEAFDVARLTKSNSLFDRKKLIAFNTEHIRVVGEENPKTFVEHLLRYLREVNSPIRDDPPGVLDWMVERTQGIRTLADFERKWRGRFITADEVKDKCKQDESCWKVLEKNGQILPAVVNQLQAMSDVVTATQVETALRNLADQHGVGLGAVAQPLRVALCGSTISASVFDLVELLPKEEALTRIHNAIQVIEGKAVL